MDVVHVLRARANILGGDVAAAKTFYETTVSAEDLLTVFGFVVADDDRLATAQMQTGDGVLVGHAARESERVGDCLLVGGVLPESGPAERRAELRAMDGENSLVADGGVAAHHDFLVSHLRQSIEQLHLLVKKRVSMEIHNCRTRCRRAKRQD